MKNPSRRDETTTQASLQVAAAVPPESAAPNTDRGKSALMSLPAIWDARDGAYSLLQQPHGDEFEMAAIEQTVWTLTDDLELSTREYAAGHGDSTPEGRMALASCKNGTRRLAMGRQSALGSRGASRTRWLVMSSLASLSPSCLTPSTM
jgi:hypothetical protein